MVASVTTRKSYMLGTTPPTLSQNVLLPPKKGQIHLSSQPSTYTSVDWSNPITRGLMIAVVPHINVNLARGHIVGPSTGYTTSNIRGGVVTNSEYLQWPEPANSTEDGAQYDLSTFTAFCYGIQSTAENSADTFSRGQGSSTANGWSIGFHGGTYIGAFANVCGTSLTPSGTFATLSKPTTALVTVESAGINLYCNGALQQSATYATPTYQYSPGSQRRVLFGSQTPQGNTTSNKLFLGLFWNRVLTPSEIISLNKNPWQVFSTGRKQIWVPV